MPNDLLTLAEAQAALRARIRPAQASETVPLAHACGRYIAADIAARVDHPGFDNSAMDGYALALDEMSRTQGLTIAGSARCGDAPGTLAAGSAMRIFTGAPLPQGADTVVIQEDVRIHGDRLHIPADTRAQQHIRRRGEDFRAGTALYRRGHRLRAADIAVLACAGVNEVTVYRRARALVIATGDELVLPGATLAPGQVYECNRLATCLQLEALGVSATDGGLVGDDAHALRAVLTQARDFDFIVTSGGASVGDHDLVRAAFASVGEIDFWRVRIKPGKPVAFGRIAPHTHFFALPGNPVSSLITFRLFVVPAVHAWFHTATEPLAIPARATHAFARSAGRMEFLRAHLAVRDGELYATPLAGQGSHQIGTLRATTALIRVEPESTGFAAGEAVWVLPLALDLTDPPPTTLA